MNIWKVFGLLAIVGLVVLARSIMFGDRLPTSDPHSTKSIFGEETVTRRIKISATAIVDGQPTVGSTTMEITWRSDGVEGGRMYIDTIGEALILELNGRGTVYVLPVAIAADGRFAGSWAYAVLGSLGIEGQALLSDLLTIKLAQGEFAVPGLGDRDLQPLMVAFGDENDKASIYEVRRENFSDHFGEGVTFSGMSFAFTEGPVTEKLIQRLPMLDESSPSNTFPRDPPGMIRPFVELPFAYKMNENAFFRKGSR